MDGVKNQAGLLSGCLFVAGSSSLLLYFVLESKNVLTNEFVYVTLVASLWSLNGVGQSLAWPSLAQIFLNWFPNPTERGSWYTCYPRIKMSAVPYLSYLSVSHALWVGRCIRSFFDYNSICDLMLMSLSTGPGSKSHPLKKKKKDDESPGFVKSVFLSSTLFLALCAGYAPISVIRISLATWTPVEQDRTE